MHNLTERGHPPASSKPAPDHRWLLDHATDAILTIGTDGTLSSLNPAFEAITGLPREEWVGKPFHPLVHPEDLPLAMDLFARALDGEHLPAFDLRILANSGLYLVGEFTSRMESRVPRRGPFGGSGLGGWPDVFMQGGISRGHVRERPEHERPLMEENDVRSVAVVPVFAGEEWWGNLGVVACGEERAWSAAEVDVLRAAAGLVGAAIKQERGEV